MALRKRKVENDALQARSNVIDAQIVARKLGIGEILRNRRVECGLEINDIADVLCIRTSILTAIEEARFDQLPGPVYAVGFIRSYAAYLGLDAEAIVLRFKTEAAEIARRPLLNFPLPMSDSRVPTGPLLIICLLLAGLIYGGWYYYSATNGRLAQIAPSVPDRLRELLSAKPAAAPVPAGTAIAEAPGQSPPAELPAQIGPAQVGASSVAGSPERASAEIVPPAGSDGVPPVENRAAAAVASAPQTAPDLAQPPSAQPSNGDSGKNPAQTAYGAPDGDARVVLRAVSDSWVQVRDKSSNLLFTRVLKPGERYNVPNQAGLTLVAGNAGGLDVAVDGTNVPPIGEPGRVARNVSLDPDRLLSGHPRAN
jgi:cytoskeleton protein RodZ